MEIITSLIGIKMGFKFILGVECLLLALAGTVALFKLMYMDRQVRRHYRERLTAYDTFFMVYRAEKQRIEEEKEARKKRIEEMKNQRMALPLLNLPPEEDLF